MTHGTSVRDLDWRAARRIAHAHGGAQPVGAETIALADAIGRALAHDTIAPSAIPAYAAAAMDGWAVCGTGPWRLREPIVAGDPPDGRALEPGEARAVTTGAAVPTGVEAVLRSEDGQVEGGWLVGDVDPARRHLRAAGEEVAAGDPIGPAGGRISPARAALLAASGVDSVVVARRPSALVAVLGDEIVDRGVPTAGLVRDVFSPTLPAVLRAAGAGDVATARVADDLDATARVFAEAGTPLVISTGGTAAGSADHVRGALDLIGADVLLERVAVRPGRPALLARYGGTLHLALPGNPLAAFVTLVTLGLPLIDGMLGRPLADPGTIRAVRALPNDRPVALVVACRVTDDGALPCARQSSAMLRGLADADLLVVVPPGGTRSGDRVPALALPW